MWSDHPSMTTATNVDWVCLQQSHCLCVGSRVRIQYMDQTLSSFTYFSTDCLAHFSRPLFVQTIGLKKQIDEYSFPVSVLIPGVCRFGSQDHCVFPCRCASGQCDPDNGSCLDNPPTCAHGKPAGFDWGGEGCQIGTAIKLHNDINKLTNKTNNFVLRQLYEKKYLNIMHGIEQSTL